MASGEHCEQSAEQALVTPESKASTASCRSSSANCASARSVWIRADSSAFGSPTSSSSDSSPRIAPLALPVRICSAVSEVRSRTYFPTSARCGNRPPRVSSSIAPGGTRLIVVTASWGSSFMVRIPQAINSSPRRFDLSTVVRQSPPTTFAIASSIRADSSSCRAEFAATSGTAASNDVPPSPGACMTASRRGCSISPRSSNAVSALRCSGDDIVPLAHPVATSIVPRSTPMEDVCANSPCSSGGGRDDAIIRRSRGRRNAIAADWKSLPWPRPGRYGDIEMELEDIRTRGFRGPRPGQHGDIEMELEDIRTRGFRGMEDDGHLPHLPRGHRPVNLRPRSPGSIPS